jgi:hypothetical protein
MAQRVRQMRRRRLSTPRPNAMSPKRRPKWKIAGPWYVRGGVKSSKCVPKDICKYLDELGDWLQEHYERALLDRLAICNLENIHYAGSGLANPVLCSSAGGDPPAEDPPPVWG